jgi:hypothetical protein
MSVTKESIRREIESFINGYRQKQEKETRWRTPLVGFASTEDPLFERVKAAVSPTHALPRGLRSWLWGASVLAIRPNGKL